MDENAEKVTPKLDEYGEIAKPESNSRWSFLEKPRRKINGWIGRGKWAANEVRTGGYKEPKPGEIAANVESLKARINGGQAVSINNQGEVVPQQVNPKGK